jgi:hypothetical protein
MNKITIHLTKSEWQNLAAWLLTESTHAERIEDKYMKALLYPLLKQVYVKRHNRLHSLQHTKNRLNLTLPEASVLATTLLESYSDHYLCVSITGIIDQKLT